VRYLGTLYEGLLEYKLKLVEKEPVIIREGKGKRIYVPLSEAGTVKRNEPRLEIGEVYFADDNGERKSSGSYYTPEDVVQYIVSNTLLSKLQECRVELEKLLREIEDELAVATTTEEKHNIERYADREVEKVINRDILNLRILDPAMGSAHFLVAAGQVMTNFIVETLNLTSWSNDAINTDAVFWKRRVVERCLYGVDVNPLAQELAKLALWLSSASVGKPLTFLDHHLKTGNSLYGATLTRISTLPTTRKDLRNDLFHEQREQSIQTARKGLEKMTEIDSELIEDVKDKYRINQEVEKATRGLLAISNVWLAVLFGLHNSQGKALQDTEYSNLIEYVTYNQSSDSWEIFVEDSYLLNEARKIAENEHFFHWELEFPDAVKGDKCEFDVIITNPPYVGKSPNIAISSLYETAKCGDLYAWLFELSVKFAKNVGRVGVVVPMSLMFSHQFKTLRSTILEKKGKAYFAAFDIRPSSLFGSSEAPNSQRACVCVLEGSELDIKEVYTTNLLRWTREERPNLIPNMQFSEITRFATSERIPKLGDARLLELWQRLMAYNRTIGTTIYRLEKKQPPPLLSRLYVSGSGRYFLTAMPEAMRSTGLNTFSFDDQWTRDIGMIALNSNIFYWIWCVIGDGFHVTVENTEMMVVPQVQKDDQETIRLRDTLLRATEECVTYQNKNGQKIPNYNFNKRMDILLDIDAWIIRYVAPDLDLPCDIFAQYKSNSFLRPLDLFDMIGIEENTAVDE